MSSFHKIIRESLVVLIVLTLWCGVVLRAEQPPTLALVHGPEDVVRYSITNHLEGGVVTQVSSPMVPLNPSANPDIYLVTLNRHADGRTIRAVTLISNRKGKYAEYDQVIIKDGKTIPVSSNFEQEVQGRKLRNYMILVSDASYAKWANEGVDLTFTGKSGRFNVVIPAFVFSTMDELFQGATGEVGGKTAAMAKTTPIEAGPPAAVPATTVEAGAKAHSAAPAPKKEAEVTANAVSVPPPAPTPAAPAPSPYLRTGSIGAQAKPDASGLGEYELPELKTEQLAGQEFIFLPMARPLREKGYVLKAFKDGDFQERRLDYERHVGQVLKVLTVLKMDEFIKAQIKDEKERRHSILQLLHRNDFALEVKIESTGEQFYLLASRYNISLQHLGLKRDIDFAIAKFPKKTFWLNRREVYTFDEAADKIVEHLIPKWQPVEITDVTLGCDAGPVRVVFKDSAGNVYFQDICVSQLNSDTYDYYGQIGFRMFFRVHFLSQDPSKKYDWPAETLKLVTDEKIRTGMTPEQVWAAWGGAKSTNRFMIGNRTSFQWIYPAAQVVFDQGKCISIIDQ